MKRRGVIVTALLVACSMLLAACEQQEQQPSEGGILENPFTIPVTTNQASDSDSGVDAPVKERFFSYEPDIYHEEDDSYYVSYDGEDVHIPFRLCSFGHRETGIGFMLFIDGIPQPYRIGGDDTYRYMHTIYPEELPHGIKEEFIFTPVTGKAGDCLDFYVAFIICPWTYREGSNILKSGESFGTGTTIRYSATPEKIELPPTTQHQYSYRVSYEDLTASDIMGWSPEEMRDRVASKFYSEGTNRSIHFGITSDQRISLRVELWGCAQAENAIVFMVDNEPLYIDPQQLNVSIKSGLKTVVEIQMDMSLFEDRMLVYPFVIPRNYKTTEDAHDSRDIGYFKAVCYVSAENAEALRNEPAES